MKSKTASVRLPKDMYEEIDELCDGIGCSRNDWIKDTLQEKLREESNEAEYADTKPTATLTRIEEPTIRLNEKTKPIFEEKPPNIPAIMRYINGQWRPHATRYSI